MVFTELYKQNTQSSHRFHVGKPCIRTPGIEPKRRHLERVIVQIFSIVIVEASRVFVCSSSRSSRARSSVLLPRLFRQKSVGSIRWGDVTLRLIDAEMVLVRIDRVNHYLDQWENARLQFIELVLKERNCLQKTAFAQGTKECKQSYSRHFHSIQLPRLADKTLKLL